MLAAQKITGLRSDQIESARTFVESSKKRAESGYASDFETIKSQAELISAQKGLLEAQGKVAAARVTLNICRSVADVPALGERFTRPGRNCSRLRDRTFSRSRWPATRVCARSGSRPKPPV